MNITRTNPSAAHRAEQHIRDLMDDAVYRDEEDDLAFNVEETATKVVDSFAAHFEYRDGLRRVVLTGEWEVDPAAITARRAVPA